MQGFGIGVPACPSGVLTWSGTPDPYNGDNNWIWDKNNGYVADPGSDYFDTRCVL